MLPNNRNKKGTGFTNLNRVLQANQGNRLGSTVAGGVQQVGQNVRQQTQQSQQSFQTEAEKNRVDTEQNKQERSNILGRFNAPASSQPANNQPSAPQLTESGRPVPTVGTAQSSGVDRSAEQPQAAAPASGTQQPTASSGFTPVSDEEVNKFARFRTGAYSGPRELENIDQLSGKAMEAEQMGQLSRSTGGRQELLRRFVGGQDYNQGQQRLDTALLGLTGQEGLAQARRETRGLGMDLAQANQAASGLAQELANRANIFGQETRDQIQQTRNPITGEIENRVQATQASEAQKQERFQKVQDIISGKGDFSRIPKEQRAILGLNTAASAGLLSQDDVQALVGQGSLLQRGFNVGADVSSLIGERLRFNQAQNLTKAGLATDEERTKLAGLNRLAGGLDSDFEFAGQDGRFQAGRGAFDYDSMNREIQRAEDEKARNDAAYRTQLDLEREEANRFFNRTVNAGGKMVDSGMGVVTNTLDGNLGAATSDLITAGAIAPSEMAVAGTLSAIEGLLKLNIGGQSIANTEVGKQLMKLTQGVGNLSNKGYDYAYDLANQFTQKPIDATGRVIGDAFNAAGQAVSNTVEEARRFLGRLCFAPDTEFLMADGKYKKVKDLSVGDETALGGKIVTIGEGITDELYQYGDVRVTGNHAVYENGKWIRVKDSKKSYPVGKDEELIYPVGTETHLLVTKGQVWADVFEIENYKSDDLQYNLDVLNSNTPRNRKLDRFLKEYFQKDANAFEKIKTPF